MRDLFMLGVFFGLLPFVFIRPHVGVMLWGWTAMFGPNIIMYGAASHVRYNFIIAIVTFISWAISKEKLRINVSSTLYLMLIFALIATLSTFNTIGNEAAAMTEWDKFIKIIALFLVILGLINSRERIHGYLWAALIALGYHGVKEGVRFILSGGTHHIFGPGEMIIGDNNHFALTMLMTLPIIWYLHRTATNKFTRMALVSAFAILFITVVGTFSRGGLIGMVAVVGWMMLTIKGKFKFAMILIPILFTAIALAPSKWFDRMETIETADKDSSFQGRVVAWKMSTLIAMDYPVIGGGFFCVQDYLVWSYYSQYIGMFDFIPTKQPDTERAHAAHSIYFQVLGDLGFGGLILFVSIMISTWRNLGKVLKYSKGIEQLSWAYDLAYALRLSAIAYTVSGAALSMAYFDLYYSIVGISINLLIYVKNTMTPERK